MPLNLKKISVLVIEDLHPMRALIVSVLDAFGVGTIYEADEGAKGFRLFQKHSPDLIITDWLMEPIDGIEFIRMVRLDKNSVNRMVPIIMMTGYSAMQRVMVARDLGATEFLTKPFSGRDLAKRLDMIINKPRDFVEADSFFGPSRRRKRGEDYTGPKRRSGELRDGGNSVSKLSPWEIEIN